MCFKVIHCIIYCCGYKTVNIFRRLILLSHKYVYLFSEGDESLRELLGGKGANLAQMVKLGMPVPQGFTVSTEA